MTIDYKSTLQLPKTGFAMKANLATKELQIQQKWQQQDLYAQIRKHRLGSKKFILHDGPPYANGDLHLGHAVNKILKDIVVKSKTMQGFDSPFIPGWDCHGLPIENQVEKKVGKAGTKGTMSDFRDKCRQYANKQVTNQLQSFQRMGIVADWQNPYLTINQQIEADTVKVLAELYKKGNLFCDFKPVYWSVVGKSALAEAEVEYYDKQSYSIDVSYLVTKPSRLQVEQVFNHKIADAELSVVIWTTTPWTIPASQAIAINPELAYSLLKTDAGSYLIIAEQLLEECLTRFGINATKIATCSGDNLQAVHCIHPLYADRQIPLILGDYVSLKGGTGCVHTAPDHGLDDFIVSKRNNIKTLQYILDNGVYADKVPLFAGIHVYKADQPVIAALKAAGRLVFCEKITHSYPHCWRTKTPLIFRATQQWFIPKLDATKIDEAIAKVNWHSAKNKSRMQQALATAPDWCITRQRVWGTPIPLIVDKQTNSSTS